MRNLFTRKSISCIVRKCEQLFPASVTNIIHDWKAQQGILHLHRGPCPFRSPHTDVSSFQTRLVFLISILSCSFQGRSRVGFVSWRTTGCSAFTEVLSPLTPACVQTYQKNISVTSTATIKEKSQMQWTSKTRATAQTQHA